MVTYNPERNEIRKVCVLGSAEVTDYYESLNKVKVR